MVNAQLDSQAFRLYHQIYLKLKRADISKIMRIRLIHAEKRAYNRYGRRLGFHFY